jgi:formylglycine-generating enzyme required for sulfatase activity
MDGRIFISYRRADAGWPASSLYNLLAHDFPREHLFMDIDSIPPGLDFVEVLESHVLACQVMVAMIGPGWLAARDDAGRRRLDDPNDFVRIEIATALRRNIRVIPVLVDGAVMPREGELPKPLKMLARRQAVRLSRERLGGDASVLVRALKEVVGGASVVVAGDPALRVRPGSGESFRDMDGGPEMVAVPAGSFIMGSPADEPERKTREGPQHTVTIAKPFAIGRHTVTRGQFDVFVRDTGHNSQNYRDPGFAQDDNHPVVKVDWEDAKAYAKWLSGKTGRNYRLPSEAEWEYAARAGTTTPYWWGQSITSEQANFCADQNGTVPVTMFQPNPWGLYQVHGNVWEWTEDCWNNTYAGAPGDGSAWTSGVSSYNVLRGGSWGSLPRVMRAAYRYWRRGRFYSTGFRVARTFTS